MQLSSTRWKYIRTAILVVLLLASCLTAPRQLLFENQLFSTVDATAIDSLDKSLVRAASAFAMARTFNGVISVFQESKLQLEPGGVGVSLALGEVLDPVNDLVERFSWIMLTSLASLGFQRFLIEISPLVSIQVILTPALLFLLAGLWLPNVSRPACMRIGRVLLVSAVVLRFAVPAMAFLNERVYISFLQEKHDRSVEALGRTAAELESHQLDGIKQSPQATEEPQAPTEELGVWGRTRELIDQTVSQGARIMEIKTRLEIIQRASLDLIDRVVDLIVVFILNTIILPLLFLWAIIRIGRFIMHYLPPR